MPATPPSGDLFTTAIRPPATPDLEKAIAAHQAAPTLATADTLLAAAQPVISRAVRAYGVDSPVIRAHAKSIILDTAPKFDQTRKVKPHTYFLTHLQGLRRFAANLGNPVKVPDQIRLDATRVARHTQDLEAELGRAPSDGEVSDASGIPLDRVAKSRGVPAAFVASTAPEGLETVDATDLASHRRAWLSYVYHDLDPIGQIILEHSLGLHGKPVLQTGEIATKVGLSAGAISQRKAKIQTMMDDYDRLFGA